VAARRRGIDRAAPESAGGRLEKALLGLLAAAPKPLGTYELLPALARLEGRAVYPHQIYRALDRLIGVDLVERVECVSGHMLRGEQPGIILVCTLCGIGFQAQGADLHEALRDLAREHGFTPGRTIVEALGRCAACAQARPNVRRP